MYLASPLYKPSECLTLCADVELFHVIEQLRATLSSDLKKEKLKKKLRVKDKIDYGKEKKDILNQKIQVKDRNRRFDFGIKIED